MDKDFLLKKIVVGCILFNLFLSGNCSADSNNKDYVLQEKCGENASAFFEKEDFSLATKDIILTKNYKNHYNKRFNKCFILITAKVNRLKTNTVDVSQVLIDVNENMEYGNIWNTEKGLKECTFQGNSCNSFEEWNTLIRPYMEE